MLYEVIHISCYFYGSDLLVSPVNWKVLYLKFIYMPATQSKKTFTEVIETSYTGLISSSSKQRIYYICLLGFTFFAGNCIYFMVHLATTLKVMCCHLSVAIICYTYYGSVNKMQPFLNVSVHCEVIYLLDKCSFLGGGCLYGIVNGNIILSA